MPNDRSSSSRDALRKRFSAQLSRPDRGAEILETMTPDEIPADLEAGFHAVVGWAKLRASASLQEWETGLEHARRAFGLGFTSAMLAERAEIAANRLGLSTSLFEAAAADTSLRDDQLNRALKQLRSDDGDVLEALSLSLTSPEAYRTTPEALWSWLESSEPDWLSEQRKAAQATVDIINVRHQQTEELFDDIYALATTADAALSALGETTSRLATKTLSGAYDAKAVSASRTATMWTVLSIGAAILGILASMFVGGAAIGDLHKVSAEQILAKFAVLLPVLALAGIFAREATHARRDARSWTHISLQLQTLKGFIGDLPPEAQQSIQHELAMRIFPGQAQDPHGDSKASDPTDVLSLLQVLQAAQKPAPKQG